MTYGRAAPGKFNIYESHEIKTVFRLDSRFK